MIIIKDGKPVTVTGKEESNFAMLEKEMSKMPVPIFADQKLAKLEEAFNALIDGRTGEVP